MAGAGLFWEKSTDDWLLVAGLFWEKSTVGWYLISQANRVRVPDLITQAGATANQTTAAYVRQRLRAWYVFCLLCLCARVDRQTSENTLDYNLKQTVHNIFHLF
jgi:hypothetical protein